MCGGGRRDPPHAAANSIPSAYCPSGRATSSFDDLPRPFLAGRARKARAVSRRPCSRDLPLPPFSSGALLAVATISGPTTMANSCCNCRRFAARAVALRRSALDRRAPRLRCSTTRTRPAAVLPPCLGATGASQVPPRPSWSAQGGRPLSVCPDQPAKRPAWHSTGPGCPLLHTVHACVC